MSIPEELRYTKDHEWVKVEGSTAVVGITHFAQGELGDIVFVDLPAVGKEIAKGQTLCVVESTKAASDVYAPVSGKVTEVNSGLAATPELLNKEPYAGGWMVKLEVSQNGELAGLLTPAQYKGVIG